MTTLEPSRRDAHHPPELVHELRSRSFHRLYRMANAPGKHGFGSQLFKRIPRMIRREQTLTEKAIATAYLCSYLADHVVLAMIEAERHVNGREMDPWEERAAWDHAYARMVHRVSITLEDGEEILTEIESLDRYTRLPRGVHGFRARHWGTLEQILILAASHALGHDAENFLRNKLMACLDSPRSPRAKARMVCLIISLMADAEAWNNRSSWRGEYARLMIDLYAELSRRPRVMAEVIRMQ